MVEVLAPAKLTVSLRVKGRRPDGYHLIDAEMVTLDLCDRLEITEGDGLEIVGPAATGIADRRLELDPSGSRRGRPPSPRADREAHPCWCGLGWRVERCGGDLAVGGHG